MQTSKRIIIATITLLLVIAVASALIIEPQVINEGTYCCDSNLRKNLAGDIDFLYVGDSDGMTGFAPEIFNKETGYNSYNLSGTMMTMHSRLCLIKKEIERNPIDTVVIQLSPEALTRNNTNYGDGDSVTLLRLDSFGERIRFLTENCSVDDWLNIYSRHLVSGMSYWLSLLQGENPNHSVDYEARGWKKGEAHDVFLSPRDAKDTLNKDAFVADFYDYSTEKLEEIIKFCKEKKIRVIIVCQPFADFWIWQTDNWDDYGNWLKEFAEKNDCRFIDFNLIKDRYVVFSDHSSFQDTCHMSQAGGESFTSIFADAMIKINNNENIDNIFFKSYSEMKKYSPYASLKN